MSAFKEPNYFSVSLNTDLLMSKPARTRRDYLALFRGVTDEVAVGEATPQYLWDPQAPRLIRDAVPHAKIIMLLRDPVERAYSHYLLLISLGTETDSFASAIQRALQAPPDYSGRLLETGLYAEQVRRYLDLFDAERVKILIFEEFVRDTHGHVRDVLRFLGVSADPPDVKEVHNPFTVPRGKVATWLLRNSLLRYVGKNLLPQATGLKLKRLLDKPAPKPAMSGEERKFLEDYYREDARRLRDLLGRPLPWSVFQADEGRS
jgi:hypothetical protein